MKDYKSTVISIIDSNGKEISLKSSVDDAKHVSAYKRLVNELDIDCCNIMKVRSSIKSIGSVTGFDISKNISADGNVVFFHNDVHNNFKGIKSASVMIPKVRTSAQNIKLTRLMKNLEREKFEIYLGEVERKKDKGKITYNRIKHSKWKEE